MDRAELGELLVSQRESQQSIDRLEQELRQMSTDLSRLATLLIESPSSVRFKNAPREIGLQPSTSTNHAPIDWLSIPDKQEIARTLEELNIQKSNLQETEKKLLA